ncbi:effector-associated domain 2-containing protein [Actinoplanes sp. NPDC049118]|uniref:VMAP-C domain-containing protein n=1 Tax=Actinoplanes sp. NPDC049118 TaxID=3155769 RepID=UPI0033CBA633
MSDPPPTRSRRLDLAEAVAILADSPVLADAMGRSMVIEELRHTVGRLDFARSASTRAELVSLIRACAAQPHGLAALAEVIALFDPHAGQRLRAAVELTEPHALLRADERHTLLELLARAAPADIAAAYRSTVGRLGPALAPAADTPDAVVELIEDAIGPPGDAPPVIRFVLFLAARLHEAPSGPLGEWAAAVAHRLAVPADQLRRAREAAADRPSYPAMLTCLQFELTQDGIHRDRYLLIARIQREDHTGMMWFADDQPRRLDDVRRQTVRLVTEMSGRLAPGDPLRVEFFLPSSLLGLPVDRWSDGGEPSIGVRYPVVVRSIDRAHSILLRRRWELSWRRLMAQRQALAADAAHWLERPAQISASLSAAEPVLVAMAAGPNDRGRHCGHEVAAVLNAGVPAMLWSRNGGDPGTVRRAIADQLGPVTMADLWRAVTRIRADATPADPHHVGHDLSLMWDDPSLLPPTQRLSAPQ